MIVKSLMNNSKKFKNNNNKLLLNNNHILKIMDININILNNN